MKQNYDVLIVGGGMVGASLACSLQHLPLKIAVIEALPNKTRLQADFDARSITLSQGSHRIFKAIGLWDELQNHALAIKKIHVSDRGHFGASRLLPQNIGVDALGYMIEVQNLNRVLYQACASADNIDWLCPAKIKSFELNDTSADVVLNHQDQELLIKAKLLVAADGANSFVCRSENISATTWAYGQSAIVGNIGLAREHQQVAYERFTDSGPIAMLPLHDKRCAMVWTVKDDAVQDILALSDQYFLKELQMAFGYRLGRFEKAGKRFSFPLNMQKSNEQIRQRLAVIGNASQTLHPIAGQGFNLGLRDVAVLVQVIGDALQSEKDFGVLAQLESYQAWRRWDQTRMIAFTDGLTRLFSNQLIPLTPGRNVGMLAFERIPALKNLFARLNMGLFGHVPDLVCGLEVQ